MNGIEVGLDIILHAAGGTVASFISKLQLLRIGHLLSRLGCREAVRHRVVIKTEQAFSFK